MRERERVVIIGLVALMLLLWLGFTVHRSPRFAGGPWGGAFGVMGALLMLWPIGYALVKRSGALTRRVMARVRMRTLLAWHVYTGVVGAILALLHTGHTFNSALGVALTASMLVVVVTGVVGRYFLGMVSQELRETKEALASLTGAYRRAQAELAGRSDRAFERPRGLFGRLRTALFVPETEADASDLADSYKAVRLAESMADLEYAIKAHELLKRRSALWLKLHIASSVLFYALLGLHVWAGVYFGLRWLD